MQESNSTPKRQTENHDTLSIAIYCDILLFVKLFYLIKFMVFFFNSHHFDGAKRLTLIIILYLELL